MNKLTQYLKEKIIFFNSLCLRHFKHTVIYIPHKKALVCKGKWKFNSNELIIKTNFRESPQMAKPEKLKIASK